MIGLDIDAALKTGAAHGYDVALLSELLPAAQAGLVEALCSEERQAVKQFIATLAWLAHLNRCLELCIERPRRSAAAGRI